MGSLDLKWTLNQLFQHFACFFFTVCSYDPSWLNIHSANLLLGSNHFLEVNDS